MRAQLAQTRYNRFASRATRGLVPILLTQATGVEKKRDCCITAPCGNAAIELRSRDAFVVEREMFRKPRATQRSDNVSREA